MKLMLWLIILLILTILFAYATIFFGGFGFVVDALLRLLPFCMALGTILYVVLVLND